MSNLLNLPQIPAGTTIDIIGSADWDDQFVVFQPGFAVTPIQVTGTLDGSTGVVTSVSSVAGVTPGMIAVGYGIPVSTTITAVGTTTITLNSNTNVAAIVPITIYPPPLDLTGITFTSKLRLTANNPGVLIVMSTTNNLMVNGLTSGQFGWSVPAARSLAWPTAFSLSGSSCFVVDV